MPSDLFSAIAILSFVVLLLIFLLRRLRQPYFIAYIIAGILLGPGVLNIIHKPDVISQLGEAGIVLLMFSIGTEVNISTLSQNFAQPLFIGVVQIIFSFICLYAIGSQIGWGMNIIILLSFVISLSSSAIVFQYLERTGEIKSQLGVITCGVLLIQDMLVIPMVLVLNFLYGSSASPAQLVKVCIGGAVILLFLWAAIRKKIFRIPMRRELVADHDLQVFIGFAICFGMAWFSNWLGLSPAFGAFSSGIVIGQDKATKWLGKSIVPFRVFFMTFFFLAIGLQLDLLFFTGNLGTILLITLVVMVLNSIINSCLFRFAGNNWRDSLYGGALLSQIGEFSFVLVTLAAKLNLVGSYTYQITLAVITCTMLFTTLWLTVIQKMIYRLPLKIK